MRPKEFDRPMSQFYMFFRSGFLAAFSALFVLFVGAFPAEAKDTERVHGQGRLFEVSAAAIEPSYVYGTMHSTDPDVVKLPPPVARAFGQSARLLLELVFTPDMQARMQREMRLTDGRTLSEVIGATLFSRVMQRAAVYGLPTGHMNTLKPWAAGLVFNLPVAELDRGASGAVALDRALQQAADNRGIPVYGLESVEEQIAAFGDMSEKDQIESLRLIIELNPQIESLFNEMKEAYLAGNLDHLHAMARRMYSGKNRRLAKQFEERFIGLRNRRMANRMARHIKQGGAFVAIGALHLSGEDGVLSLLEKRGYKVRQIY
jgi:uncharacterized protein YbaP (TraB family)